MAAQEIPSIAVVTKPTSLAAKLIKAMSQVGVVQKRGNNSETGLCVRQGNRRCQ
jgi:hypothetical protein